MRRSRFTKYLAVLAALTLMFWLVSPTWAESGCHKIKSQGSEEGGYSTIVLTLH